MFICPPVDLLPFFEVGGQQSRQEARHRPCEWHSQRRAHKAEAVQTRKQSYEYDNHKRRIQCAA